MPNLNLIDTTPFLEDYQYKVRYEIDGVRHFKTWYTLQRAEKFIEDWPGSLELKEPAKVDIMQLFAKYMASVGCRPNLIQFTTEEYAVLNTIIAEAIKLIKAQKPLPMYEPNPNNVNI